MRTLNNYRYVFSRANINDISDHLENVLGEVGDNFCGGNRSTPPELPASPDVIVMFIFAG